MYVSIYGYIFLQPVPIVKQVGKETVTLEISAGLGADNLRNGEMMANILEQGRYGQVSIERKPAQQPAAAAAPAYPPVPETYYTPQELTDEQRAQLEGYVTGFN